MKVNLKFFSIIFIVFLALFSYSPNKVLADSEELEIGDKIYFAGREWVVMNLTSSEWFLMTTANYDLAYWNAEPSGYIGSQQDSKMINLYNSMSDADRALIKGVSMNSAWYNYASLTSSGSNVTRYIYGIHSTEWCQYCYGRGYCNGVGSSGYVGCGGQGSAATLTRVGHYTDRGAYNRPIYFDTNLSGVSCNASSVSLSYALNGQKNSSDANVNYFSLASSTSTQINIAGATPGDTYTLDIQETRSFSPGSVSGSSTSSGCYAYDKSHNASSPQITWNIRPTLRIDPTKVTGITWDSSHGRWNISGSTIPHVATSYQSGSKDYSTSAQSVNFAGSNRTKKIIYSLTINGLPNRIQFGDSSATVSYSPNAQNIPFNPATNADGALTYSIYSQKNSGGSDVTYFTIPTNTSNTVRIEGGAVPGVYSVVIKAHAAGNIDYTPGDKYGTLTVTIEKAVNPMTVDSESQAGTIVYSPDARNKGFDGGGGAQGAITYSIYSQVDGTGSGVSYFTIPNNTAPTIAVAAGTPVDQYSLVINVTAAGNSNYQSLTKQIDYIMTVEKADPIITAPTGKDLTYNGSPQVLIDQGSTNAGTMYYKADSGEWNTSLPSATTAGAHSVQYKVVGNSNYNDVDPQNMTVTIKKANITVTDNNDKTYTYTGSPQGTGVSAHGVASDPVTIVYGLTSGNYNLNNPPQITNVSQSGIVVYYKASADNHNDATGSYKLFMNPKSIAGLTLDSIPLQVYEGVNLEPTLHVRDGDKELAVNTDYTAAYTDNYLEPEHDSGVGHVVVTGKGNYTGTLNGQFDIAAKEYTITFKGNGASSNVPKNVIKKYGCTLKLPTNTPIRNGYQFEGYGTSSLNSAASRWKAGDNYAEEGNATLYAHWSFVFKVYRGKWFYETNNTATNTPDTLKYTTYWHPEKMANGNPEGGRTENFCYFYHPDNNGCVLDINDDNCSSYPYGAGTYPDPVD